MKSLQVADFREKVELLRATVTVDSELNRTESFSVANVVWAAVEVRSASIDNTVAGHKDLLKYKFTIRKQSIECDYVRYHGKVLVLTCPWYEVDNKYIVIEAVEQSERILAEST